MLYQLSYASKPVMGKQIRSRRRGQTTKLTHAELHRQAEFQDTKTYVAKYLVRSGFYST